MEFSRKELISWVVAIALTVGGIVTLIAAMQQQTRFGWFAYAPLSESTYAPDPSTTFTTLGVLGIVLLGLGLLAVGFLSGMRFARRRRATG
ncbi:hypothetical protein [Nesterenkonia sp. Act20]|uniref:hypothetical protein n=1 Tax=Nesterenkonia sp. Act20 TaxID=1483432 RepID=UPI001C44C1A6|nr:hypothetical protein [Nesterenkonia sp. Act20]